MIAIHKSKPTFFKTLSHILPPPRFLTMPGIGMDISDHAVRYLELIEHRSGAITIGRFGMEPLAEEIIEQGEIRDKDALISILKKIKSKADIDYVHASLPDEKAYLFQTFAPKTKDAQSFRNSVEFRLEENIPLSPRDAIFDYNIVDQEGDELEVSAIAIPNQVAEEYFEVLHEAGIVPLSFEIEAEAIGRAVLSHSARETGLIVDFGAKKSNVMIVVGDVVRFTTVIDIGSRRLTSALSKHLNISDQEAEQIKINHGFVPTKDNKAAFEVLATVVSVLRDEIQRYLIYWNTHRDDGLKNPPIERILLCGGGANLQGLTEYLAACFELPVAISDVWVNCFSPDQYLPEIGRDESLSYVTAVGLALRGLRSAS
jgi:type IV pilus assembly protein PilM